MSSPQSESVSWRDKGNKIFQSVTPNLAPILRESRLLEALQQYNRAIDTASDDTTELSSGAKNCALASWKLALAYRDQEKMKLMFHYFKEALKYFTKSHNGGQKTQSLDWVQHLNSKIFECTVQFLGCCVKYSCGEERGRIIHITLPYLHLKECQLEACLELANTYFGFSVQLLEQKKYREALHFLRECYWPVEELRRIGRDDEQAISEANVLTEDVMLQTCLAESMQARATGDGLVDKALTDYEDLPVGLLWDAVDWYRKAILLTREKEVEMEAIAFSRLGSLFHKLLNIKHRARECFKRSIELAHTLHPRTFNTEAWFKEASQTLELYQKDAINRDEKKDEEERAAVLEELKKEIDKLKDMRKRGDCAFLNFVYEEHKPLNPGHKLLDKCSDNLKKAFKEAIIHYHPDKVDANTHGKKLKVLHEEITKMLTYRYECFKGED